MFILLYCIIFFICLLYPGYFCNLKKKSVNNNKNLLYYFNMHFIYLIFICVVFVLYIHGNTRTIFFLIVIKDFWEACIISDKYYSRDSKIEIYSTSNRVKIKNRSVQVSFWPRGGDNTSLTRLTIHCAILTNSWHCQSISEVYLHTCTQNNDS